MKNLALIGILLVILSGFYMWISATWDYPKVKPYETKWWTKMPWFVWITFIVGWIMFIPATVIEFMKGK